MAKTTTMTDAGVTKEQDCGIPATTTRPGNVKDSESDHGGRREGGTTVASKESSSPAVASSSSAAEAVATAILDRECDAHGLTNILDDATDWTDVKHSERKKRDRFLDDRVLLTLVQKSDYEGFKRFFTNLLILILTALACQWLFQHSLDEEGGGNDGEHILIPKNWTYMVLFFLPTYLFYGFQIQCFGYSAQHELMHRTAFRTRWINDMLLFWVSVPSFEFGKHEKVMHKQHHTYTNNIHKDPELTSFWTTEQLQNPNFRKVSSSRMDYLREYLDLASVIQSHVMRIYNSARGIPVDYTGMKWSLSSWNYSDESGILTDLQTTARIQLVLYGLIFLYFGRTQVGIWNLCFYWLIPTFLGYPMINFIRNAEHSDCEISTTMNCLTNTRSCRSNCIVRQLCWNMNYHAEHHLYPMVPFYNLPKLSVLLEDQVVHNDIRHFTFVNWEYVKGGGWIDQQNASAPMVAKGEEEGEESKKSK